MKFITGTADIETEFDDYVAKLNELGLQELQEVYEASYARFVER